MTTDSASIITLRQMTGSEVFETDQSDPSLTREQADAVAERYNELLLTRVLGLYPDAEIDFGSRFSVAATSWQIEEEVTREIDAIASSLWESGEVWDGVSA